MIHPDTELVVVDSLADCNRLLKWMNEERSEVIGVDSETTGLTWNRPGDDLRLVQVGDETHGFAIPWHRFGGAFLEALNTWDGRIALHNANFDLKFFKRYADWEIPWEQIDDTMIMAKVVFPGQPATLKGMAEKYIDPRADIGQIQLKEGMKKNGWDWATVPLDYGPYVNYSCLDPVLTVHLYNFLKNHENFNQDSYDLEMGMLRMAFDMEYRGMRIDVDYCRQKRDELREYVDSAKEYAKEEFGVSVGSSVQLVKFFQEHNQTFTQLTPKGHPSANAEQIEEFTKSDDEDVADLANLVLQIRKADKLATSYFENFMNMHVDGVVHPTINTMGAITGRMSVRDPALQTLPSGSNIVRKAFLPRYEGEVIVTSDYDQMEARIFASFSSDPGFQEAFRIADETGSDFFTEIGRIVYDDPTLQKSDDRRKLIKTYIYSSLFGSGVAKQAKSAGVPIEVMQEVADKIAKRFPNMKKFQAETARTVEIRARESGVGYVETELTKHKLPVESDKAYKGVNYRIQGTGAEYMKRALLKMDAMGIGHYLLLPVHDEVIASCPAEEAEEVKKIMADCMRVDDLDVPLTSGSEGPVATWGDKYE